MAVSDYRINILTHQTIRQTLETLQKKLFIKLARLMLFNHICYWLRNVSYM